MIFLEFMKRPVQNVMFSEKSLAKIKTPKSSQKLTCSQINFLERDTKVRRWVMFRDWVVELGRELGKELSGWWRSCLLRNVSCQHPREMITPLTSVSIRHVRGRKAAERGPSHHHAPVRLYELPRKKSPWQHKNANNFAKLRSHLCVRCVLGKQPQERWQTASQVTLAWFN